MRSAPPARSQSQLARYLFGAVAVALFAAQCDFPTGRDGDRADEALGAADARVYEGARAVYLDDGAVRVGVDKQWGGALRELWHDGRDLIDHYDGGRLAWVSVYDGAHYYNQDDIRDPDGWGWNPTPSDKYDHRNTPAVIEERGNTLYVRSTNLQWNPDDKGGSSTASVESELEVESWLSFLSGFPTVLRARFKSTYRGDVSHSATRQEFPFLYVPPAYDRVVAYTGDDPWTGADIAEGVTGFFSASEQWVAFVNAEGYGLTLFAPHHYPLISAKIHDVPPHDDDSGYATPFLPHAYPHGASRETTVYLIPGHWREARARIELLRGRLDLSDDRAPPYGALDNPIPDATVSGETTVAGWAIDDTSVDSVEVVLDGSPAGEAAYGNSRTDVAEDYPGLPGAPDFGFRFTLDTAALESGFHRLWVRIEDRAGNAQRIGSRRIEVE